MDNDEKSIIKLFEQHLTISSKFNIADAIKPLETLLDIKYFTFIRIFPDNSRFVLSSDPGINLHYIKTGLYRSGFIVKFENYKSGYFLTSSAITSLERNQMLLHLRKEYGLDHGLTIINKQKGFVELALFAADKENYTINSLYLNYRDIFQRFIDDFKQSSQEVFRLAYLSRFKQGGFYTEDQDAYNNKIKQRTFNKIRNSKVLTDLEKCSLLLEGLGNHDKEVAKLMHRSPETIKTYAKSIKKKLGAKTKTHAIVQALLKKEISLSEIEALGEKP